MSTARQFFDVLVAVVLSVVVTAAVSQVLPGLAQSMGLLAASGFYFSRHPWGARDGDRVNDRIDAIYDEYLPF